MSIPRLLTPGPVAVPEMVLEAIQQQPIPHRSATFEAFYGALLSRLRYLYQSQGMVCTLIGSGTYGVEITLRSLIRPESKVLVVHHGKFSQRWRDDGTRQGWQVHNLASKWGEVPEPGKVIEHAQQIDALAAIVLTHCETSTGVMLDLEEVARGIQKVHPDCLILVDGITTVGCVPFYFDDWGIDAAVCASQKALMNPAGLATVALSERAEAALLPTHHSDFANLYNYVSFARDHSYPYTAPVQLLFGLKAALDHIQEVGLPRIWNQTIQSARYFRQGIQELGGELFGAANGLSLTAFSFPGKDSDELRRQLEAASGFVLSGGQGELKGNIMRISHMGMADQAAMSAVLAAFSTYL
ncbi:MAG: alanine--glyoxylate aminotransferase family protein [Bacteroidota bacterium]